MELFFNTALASGYKSPSQKIRVMSEDWVAGNVYCPCCGNDALTRFENNRPVADFYCGACGEIFELKSKEGKIGRKIVDGEYHTAIERITSNSNPGLFVLSYSPALQVVGLRLIPKFFFVTDVIESRKPLAPTARRAGWTGCNILYSEIPRQGRISIIEDSVEAPKQAVLESYRQSKALMTDDLTKREWLFDVLQCVNSVDRDEFTLSDIYRFEETLSQKHPLNHNLRAKIRQQLQLLRDKGYIVFLGNGRYRKIL